MLESTGKHIDGLDLLKVIATLLIVFHHYQQVFSAEFDGINFCGGFFSFGILVELFFMISGFVALYAATKREAIRPFREFLHKLLRLYPIPTIALAFTLIVKSVDCSVTGNDVLCAAMWNWKSIIANLLLIFRGWPLFSMTGVNNPTWYLCILIQCYIVFLFVLWLCDRVRGSRLARMAAFVLCAAIAFVLQRFGLISHDSFRGLESFFLGAAECELLQLPQIDSILKKKRIRPLAVLLTVAAIAASVILIVPVHYEQRRTCIFGVFPFLILLAYCYRDQECRVIRTLGSVSFDVYVWHYPLMALEMLILDTTNSEISRSYLTMALFAVLTWLFAWVIHQYIEGPISRWIGKREQRWAT